MEYSFCHSRRGNELGFGILILLGLAGSTQKFLVLVTLIQAQVTLLERPIVALRAVISVVLLLPSIAALAAIDAFADLALARELGNVFAAYIAAEVVILDFGSTILAFADL